MTDYVIETHDLCKSYGTVEALSDANLQVVAGEVFGYLGPNGAGKTTTIRTLLDLIRPTSGSASIFGMDTRRDSAEIQKRIGYLPGDVALYEKLTGREALTYSASLRGGVDWSYVVRLAERLDSDLSPRIRSLSRGNRQKIGLIQAFMHKPDLIFMDEPTSGLDPLIQQEFYAIVEEVKAEGATVFVSSHILPEVERICDRVGIIRAGKIITVEDVDLLKERALHQLEFQIAGPVSEGDFADLSGVRDVSVEDGILRCTVEGKPDALIKAVARFEVVKLASSESSLEDIFLSYYGEGGNAA